MWSRQPRGGVKGAVILATDRRRRTEAFRTPSTVDDTGPSSAKRPLTSLIAIRCECTVCAPRAYRVHSLGHFDKVSVPRSVHSFRHSQQWLHANNETRKKKKKKEEEKRKRKKKRSLYTVLETLELLRLRCLTSALRLLRRQRCRTVNPYNLFSAVENAV